jgi:hypothetical protein
LRANIRSPCDDGKRAHNIWLINSKLMELEPQGLTGLKTKFSEDLQQEK